MIPVEVRDTSHAAAETADAMPSPAAGLPPLVAPGAPLTADEVERYRRQLTLPQLGTLGQRRLRAASVLLVGAGGLGTPALLYLAGAGIGTLGVVDDDLVEVSNLHRQVVHGVDGVGMSKVDSAAAAVARLNPDVAVRRHGERLTAENAVDLVGGYDVVVDGSDNFATRYLVADASEITGVPVVWGAILRGQGQASVFWPGRGAHYRDVFPEPPAPGSVPSCAEAGVLGTLPGVVGTILAAQVIQLVTGTGDPLVGRMLLWDEATTSGRSVRIVPDPARAPATRVEIPAAADPSCRVGRPAVGETLDVPALHDLLGTGVTVVDVREPWEVDAGAIDGSVNVPLAEVLARGARALPAGVGGGDVVLYCHGGVRSAQALERLRPDWVGRDGKLWHLDGGYEAWALVARLRTPGGR